MKHLQPYQIFESNSIEEIKQYLEDIFRELTDIGFIVGVSNIKDSRISSGGIYKISIYKSCQEHDSYSGNTFFIDPNGVYTHHVAITTFKYSDVVDSIESSKEYMKSIGYKCLLKWIDSKSYIHDSSPEEMSYINKYSKNKKQSKVILTNNIKSIILSFVKNDTIK